MRQLIVIMGVSGCGKTTVGQLLSRALTASFLEGDDFHPEANITKMTAGKPLTDNDRALWLDNILQAVNASASPTLTLACSALTPYVQSRLTGGTNRTISWVWLSAPYETIAARLKARDNHFMPVNLLKSQFAALSPPEDAIEIGISGSADAAVDIIIKKLSAL